MKSKIIHTFEVIYTVKLPGKLFYKLCVKNGVKYVYSVGLKVSHKKLEITTTLTPTHSN